ncbi:MAG: 1,4-dihydroxy-2-naphthoate octaprenyltransferase [Acidobacteria bacterium ADurb.Bin340]|nr:MAG: 1,4-dihydroxy-2-naphthoate octaprenyltransferase [Acidobacteria bacterium ADurb.Bin340]
MSARSLLNRLLGPKASAYVLHLRPMEWPIMTAHFLLGTLLAQGWGLPPGRTLLGWLAYVVCLNGATLAINSAFDQDQGDIGYLKDPPKPPKHLLAFSLALHALGLGCALPFLWMGGSAPWFFHLVAACTVMSVLYSVPPARLKARAGWDLLINCLGFGLMTPLAGWALTGRPFSPAALWAAAGFGLLFAALYPATQIYQVEEDRARGDRTLVIRLGVPRSLVLALVAIYAAHGCFWIALRSSEGTGLALLLSVGVWQGLFIAWRCQWQTWTLRQQEAGMYWALACWAITDLSLLWALWPR